MVLEFYGKGYCYGVPSVLERISNAMYMYQHASGTAIMSSWADQADADSDRSEASTPLPSNDNLAAKKEDDEAAAITSEPAPASTDASTDQLAEKTMGLTIAAKGRTSCDAAAHGCIARVVI